jgi:glycogen operon protein
MTGIKQQIKPYPLGAHCEDDHCIRFSFVSKKDNCGIILYDKKSGRKKKKIPFTHNEKIGDIYCKYIDGVNPEELSYQFYEEDRIVPDIRARVFTGRHVYGKERQASELKAGFVRDDFDWGNDKRPCTPYEDCIVYCMHVRGFTRHSSSNVMHKGTFAGACEKISYLKSIGITTIELQPAYEFLEIPDAEERRSFFPGNKSVSEADLDKYCPKKLNYWGYKRGFYYAPKSSYAFGDDASIEFKQMVKSFHEAGIEVVMQFYFPNDVDRQEIADILRFWVLTYHVDGFHLCGVNLPITAIAGDSALTDTKIWYYGFDTENIYEKNEVPGYRNLAEYKDSYMYDMRRYLKGDENMLPCVLEHMKYNPLKCGNINYFTNYYGFTMMDMVSFDRKHNEANGEDNRDGNDMNCSWNCGEEGKSRKKRVNELRKKQIKNAMCMLLLSQGTPLIFMGDEFGNSQNGNNNPYCQDNAVTWLDWSMIDTHRELHDFWRCLVMLRKAHPILHLKTELRMIDSLSCGYPDMSYHGQNAWRAQLESYNRHVGIMYCGRYARKPDGCEDSTFYLAMNMYWEPRKLGMPKLPAGMRWKQILCTASETECSYYKERSARYQNLEENEHLVPDRTIGLFIAVHCDKTEENRKSLRRKKKASELTEKAISKTIAKETAKEPAAMQKEDIASKAVSDSDKETA